MDEERELSREDSRESEIRPRPVVEYRLCRCRFMPEVMRTRGRNRTWPGRGLSGSVVESGVCSVEPASSGVVSSLHEHEPLEGGWTASIVTRPSCGGSESVGSFGK